MSTEVMDLVIDYDIPPYAEKSLIILPVKPEHEMDQSKYVVYASTVTSVMKLLKANDIPIRLAVEGGREVAYQENRSFDWFAPTILITASLLSQNPQLVSIAINLISSYIYEIFKGKSADPSTRCTFAYIGKGKKKKVHYEGPVSGLSKIPDIIKEIDRE